MPDDFKLPEEWRDAVLDAIRNSRAVGTEDEVDVALSAITPHVRELVEALQSIEQQCVQADDPEHHTLGLVKHIAMAATAKFRGGSNG